MRTVAAFPLVLGHRGFRARWPENTMLAFRKSLEAGADGIECDVQKTADGRYVIIHDDTVDRTSNGHGAVASMAFTELRALDFGQGERIPSLEEMLALVGPAHWLDLELKDETITVEDFRPVAAAVDRAIPRERLMISSFKLELLVPFQRAGYTVGYLLGEEAYARGFRALALDILRLRPRFLNLPVQTMERLGIRRTLGLLAALRFFGIELLWWTVNDLALVEPVLGSSRILVGDDADYLAKAKRAAAEGRLP